MNMYLKPYCLLFSLLCISCQAPSNQDKLLIQASAPKNVSSKGNLQRLVGTWISRSHNGFVLLRINPDSTGTFTWYNDSARGHRATYPSPHYSFNEEPVKVRYRPQNGPIRYIPNIEVQIWNNGARDDYELSGDTLREIDKMGYQGSLVRLHPTAANQ